MNSSDQIHAQSTSLTSAGFRATVTMLLLMLLGSISGMLHEDWATSVGNTLVGGAIMPLSAPWWAALALIVFYGSTVVPLMLLLARRIAARKNHSFIDPLLVSVPAWAFFWFTGSSAAVARAGGVSSGLLDLIVLIILAAGYGFALAGFSIPEKNLHPSPIPASPEQPARAENPLPAPLAGLTTMAGPVEVAPMASNQPMNPLVLRSYGDSRKDIRG